ncbi:MAG: hypothetical protein ABI462_12475, partial [Ignavibacteria bacterium]
MKPIILCLLFLIINTSYSQDNSYNVFKINHAKTVSNDEAYKKSVDDAVILNIDKELFNSIFTQKDYRITVTIPVSEGQNIYADLERFEILTPDAKIIERSARGEKEVDLRNIVLSYHGKISGIENSLVSISFYDGKVLGVINYENDIYTIGALKDNNNIDTEDFIIYRESKIKFKRDLR